MASLESVNVGAFQPCPTKWGRTGIDKHPVAGPLHLAEPEQGESGVAGDSIGETPNHGGRDQAVYAYAREDLDAWAATLGEPLRGGLFGENLTTVGVDVTGAVIGETWRVGEQVVLQVTMPRTPCATFALQMDRPRWVRDFTRYGAPGAYLRVLEPGEVRAGDPVTVLDRPDSPLTIGIAFRALNLEPELLPLFTGAPLVPRKLQDTVARRTGGRVPTG